MQRVRLKAEPNSGFSATVPQNPDDLHYVNWLGFNG